MVSGGSLALIVFALLSPITLRNLLFLLLPLTYISSLVLWLLVFVFLFFFHLVEPGWQGFIYFWNKVIAVGCLTFFLWVQALWGLRNHSWPFCILLAVDDALPIAFVAMLFGELMAATAGLGFVMTVASATYQYDKGLAGFLITAGLLAGISSSLRFVAKKLYAPEEDRELLPA